MSERAEVLARHVSPDSELVWRVERETEADGRVVVSFGFEGGLWHLHPEYFDTNARSDEQIAADVTADLLADHLVIVAEQWPGRSEIRLLDDLELLVDFKQPDDKFEFRLWSGRKLTFDELVDGVPNVKTPDVNWGAKR